MPWTKADSDLLRLSVEQKFKQWQDEVFGKEPERKVRMSRLTPVGMNGTVATKNGLVVTVNQLLGMQENQRAELVKRNKTIVDLRSKNSDLEDECNKLHRRNAQLTKRVQGAMDRTSKVNETLTEHIAGSINHEGCNDTLDLYRIDNAALRNQIKVMGDVSVTQQELIVHPEHINTADVEIQLRGQAILKLCHRAHDRKQTIYGLRQAVSGYRKKLKELSLG